MPLQKLKPKISESIRRQAKKYNIRLTTGQKTRRYKSVETLKTQIKNAKKKHSKLKPKRKYHWNSKEKSDTSRLEDIERKMKDFTIKQKINENEVFEHFKECDFNFFPKEDSNARIGTVELEYYYKNNILKLAGVSIEKEVGEFKMQGKGLCIPFVYTSLKKFIKEFSDIKIEKGKVKVVSSNAVAAIKCYIIAFRLAGFKGPFIKDDDNKFHELLDESIDIILTYAKETNERKQVYVIELYFDYK